jgi:hypothetical protein
MHAELTKRNGMRRGKQICLYVETGSLRHARAAGLSLEVKKNAVFVRPAYSLHKQTPATGEV